MQLVDPPHDRQLSGRDGTGTIIETSPADPQHRRLVDQWQLVAAVDHRLALGWPALPSAADKKSFSRLSSPIFACSVFRSTAGSDCLPDEPAPNRLADPSTSCAFHAVICVGCTS